MKTKIFSIFLTLVASVGSMFAQSGTCGDNLTWNLSNGTLTISGTGEMDDSPWSEYYESIMSVIINDGVTSIGDGAFWFCTSLLSVTIGNSVTSIGQQAFGYCSSLPSVIIPNSVTSIGDEVFYECNSLLSVTIGNSVTIIGGGAFRDCSSLTSVTIPNSVTSIEDEVFYECNSLTSVTIPNSVTNIGAAAFKGCNSLTSMTIPNSVTSIGEFAFYECSSFTYVTCYATTPPQMGNKVFSHVDCSQIPLYVPEESVNAYKSADQWKEFNPILPISDQEDIRIVSEEVNDSNKLLRDGQVLILRGDRTYTLTGQEVK